jgi:hypothetical protein
LHACQVLVRHLQEPQGLTVTPYGSLWHQGRVRVSVLFEVKSTINGNATLK